MNVHASPRSGIHEPADGRAVRRRGSGAVPCNSTGARRGALPQNALIASLPRADRVRLLDLCRSVDLVLAEVLCERGQMTRYVHFPIDGFVSLIAEVDHHPGLEVGMVGREGMLGVHLSQGQVREPLRQVVQGAGASLRLGAGVFRRELARSTALRHCIGRYVYVLMAQRAASASCLRYHEIGPRLARWLLMSQDRADADRFHVTHEFLGYMLGVRRVGVTVAAGLLQRQGLIEYRRGELEVLDRAGLEAASCGCYAADQSTYADAMS